MSATCSTCRFWSPLDTRDGYDADFDDVELPHRKCVAVIHGNSSEECTRVPQVLSVPAMVCDGSGYAASFWTLPTFGCAMHEAKP